MDVESRVMSLCLYASHRHHMPVHQAARFAREAIAELGEDATAEDSFSALDRILHEWREGHRP